MSCGGVAGCVCRVVSVRRPLRHKASGPHTRNQSMADLLDRVHPRPGGGLCRDGQWPLGCALPSFSQLAEDQFAISEIFPGKQGGTFIEVGGYNGLWMSNSRTLEWMFGWSGLLVEAHPRLFDELSANRGKQSVTVHSAVCNGTQSVTGVQVWIGLFPYRWH